MPWATGNREAIRLYCELPPLPEWYGVLDNNMNAASEAIITTVQASLAELEDLETELNSQLQADSSLVRADVLEWQPGRAGAGRGIRQLMDRHVQRIRLALMLPVPSDQRGSGLKSIKLV